MTADLQPHWSESIRAWAAGQPLVLGAYAFGSRIKGGYEPESDLDIALDVAGEDEDEKRANWIFQERQWTAELQEFLPVRLDLQCMLPGDKVVTPAVKDHGLLIYRLPQA